MTVFTATTDCMESFYSKVQLLYKTTH